MTPCDLRTRTFGPCSTDARRGRFHHEIGIFVPLPAYLVNVGVMARTAEALGFEFFWCAEHPFIPVHTTTRFPFSTDGVTVRGGE
jgi:alkanesulfonate monooxygenase SsuD/methylene tetrahydromethanopterin reductase-like flavin-dependent oxidoreductase (luciferase family)